VEDPLKPKLETALQKEMANELMKDFIKRFKYVTYDRLEGDISKRGRNLPLGSFRKDLFDHVLGNWKGKREIKIYKKRCRKLAYNVFITHEFNETSPILKQLPMKIETVNLVLKNKRVVQQIRHRYKILRICLDVATDRIHANWRQITERLSENGKDWEESK